MTAKSQQPVLLTLLLNPNTYEDSYPYLTATLISNTNMEMDMGMDETLIAAEACIYITLYDVRMGVKTSDKARVTGPTNTIPLRVDFSFILISPGYLHCWARGLQTEGLLPSHQAVPDCALLVVGLSSQLRLLLTPCAPD